MGLDMYFKKIKKVKNKSVIELLEIQHKINYSENESEKEKLIKLYNDFLEKNYYEWLEKDYYSFDTEIGYLRKANAIHNFIVKKYNNGVDNCEPILLDKEKIEEMFEIVKKLIYECKLINGKLENGYTYKKNDNGKLVKEYNYENGYILDQKSKKLASELLPTRDGFFFGSTEYDQWYYKKVKDTIEIIEKVLAETDFEHEIVMYSSSW